MAQDPVMGPISSMENPLTPKQLDAEKLPQAEEVQDKDKEVHDEMIALEADSVNELVAGLEEIEKEEEKGEVQLEAEAEQTIEHELRTELEMRSFGDVLFMARRRGIDPVTGLSKEGVAHLILQHDGFEPPASVDTPRSARVKRIGNSN